MKTGSTIVAIDEIRLFGFDPHKSSAIGEAIERTLRRMFSDHPAPQQSSSIAALDAGTFRVRRNASAEKLGSSIAARVHRGVRSC